LKTQDQSQKMRAYVNGVMQRERVKKAVVKKKPKTKAPRRSVFRRKVHCTDWSSDPQKGSGRGQGITHEKN